MIGPTNPKTHRRHGFMLMEVVVTLALIALVATLATQVMFRIFETGRSLGVGERAGLATDHVVVALRRDTERAGGVIRSDGPATLTLGEVTWSGEPDALVRTRGGQVDRFDRLPGAPAMAWDDGFVTLRIGDLAWAFMPLVDRPADAAIGGE